MKKTLHAMLAGFKDKRRNPITKSWCVVFDAEAQGIDSSEKYVVVCDTHGSLLDAPTIAFGRTAAAEPEEWCEECRAERAKWKLTDDEFARLQAASHGSRAEFRAELSALSAAKVAKAVSFTDGEARSIVAGVNAALSSPKMKAWAETVAAENRARMAAAKKAVE